MFNLNAWQRMAIWLPSDSESTRLDCLSNVIWYFTWQFWAGDLCAAGICGRKVFSAQSKTATAITKTVENFVNLRCEISATHEVEQKWRPKHTAQSTLANYVSPDTLFDLDENFTFHENHKHTHTHTNHSKMSFAFTLANKPKKPHKLNPSNNTKKTSTETKNVSA